MTKVKELLAFWLPNYTCLGCGAEIETSPNPHLCARCLAALPFLPDQPATHYSPFAYAEPVRSLILALKHASNGLVATALAPYLAAIYLRLIKTDTTPVIVPVPLYRQRHRERGYNQSLVLAHALAENLGLPVRDDAIVRVKNTKMQKHMTAAERLANLQDAFAPGPAAAQLCDQDVILLDDVYTTGATTQTCAAVIRRCGARRVTILTIATAGL